MKPKAALLTVITFCGIIAAHIGIIWLAQGIEFSLGPTTTGGNTRFSFGLIIFFAYCAFIAVLAYIYAGYEDEKRDLLYWPQAALKTLLFLYVSLLCVGVVDVLLHGLDRPPHWTILNHPLVRLYANLAFAAAGCMLLWMGLLILYNRWRNAAKVALFLLVTTALLVVGAVVLISLATIGRI